MATARDIRRRIRTVKNIEKITNAMKMVAAARLKKAQAGAEAARPYAEKMHEVMANLAASTGHIRHPLLEVREQRTGAYVIVGADRGLAVSYNSSVMNKALDEIADRDSEDVKLVLVGKKAAGFFKRRPYEVVATLQPPRSEVSFVDIRGITTKARSMFESREVDAVYLVYARFITAMTQRPTSIKLLPIATPGGGEALPSDFIFEPQAEKLLASLLPRDVDTEGYQALVEAQASEHGARMTSMTAATKNAGEMIDNLTLIYNKARQAAITREIVEIVGGAEALK